jgi:hypothetical protein
LEKRAAEFEDFLKTHTVEPSERRSSLSVQMSAQQLLVFGVGIGLPSIL